MSGIPQSQHEAEIASKAMRDEVNGANSRCSLPTGSERAKAIARITKRHRAYQNIEAQEKLELLLARKTALAMETDRVQREIEETESFLSQNVESSNASE